MGFSLTAVVKSVEPAQKRIYGWASVATDESGAELVDHQGDTIPARELEEAAYDYMVNARGVGENHKRVGVGKLISSVVLTPEIRKAMGVPEGPTGWFVGFQITDDSVWNAVTNGDLPELSIHGTAEEHES